MKFPKLHLACADDELCPAMECVCVGKEFTYASDAHILVRHKTSEIFDDKFVESLPENNVLIPRKAIYLMCQKLTTGVNLSDDKKSIILKRTDGSEISFKFFTDRSYVDAESVIPKDKNYDSVKRIGLSSNLLDRLADAMGCNQSLLQLYFYGETKSVIVKTNYSDYESVLGLIMPVMIND